MLALCPVVCNNLKLRCKSNCLIGIVWLYLSSFLCFLVSLEVKILYAFTLILPIFSSGNIARTSGSDKSRAYHDFKIQLDYMQGNFWAQIGEFVFFPLWGIQMLKTRTVLFLWAFHDFFGS